LRSPDWQSCLRVSVVGGLIGLYDCSLLYEYTIHLLILNKQWSYSENLDSIVTNSSACLNWGIKGRDQLEWIGLWKVAIDRHLVRIVVIDTICYFNVATILE
jgi:hypothetical protein